MRCQRRTWRFPARIKIDPPRLKASPSGTAAPASSGEPGARSGRQRRRHFVRSWGLEQEGLAWQRGSRELGGGFVPKTTFPACWERARGAAAAWRRWAAKRGRGLPAACPPLCLAVPGRARRGKHAVFVTKGILGAGLSDRALEKLAPGSPTCCEIRPAELSAQLLSSAWAGAVRVGLVCARWASFY